MMEERMNDIEMRVIAERVDNLKDQLEKSDKISENWRKIFCQKLDATNIKLDALITKVDTLPCPVRIEQTKGLMTQVRALWLLTGGMLITIISEWLKGNS